MKISRALAIKILRYCSIHKNFYFPFLVMCKEYSPEDDDYVEIAPEEWRDIELGREYKTFELWENLQDIDLQTLKLMSKGFLDKVNQG